MGEEKTATYEAPSVYRELIKVFLQHVISCDSHNNSDDLPAVN